MHTMFCDDDHDILVLSCELVEKLPYMLFPSDDLVAENGDPKLTLALASEPEPPESRGAIAISWAPEKEGNTRSVPGLLDDTNDMSVSGIESSPYDLFEALILVNGDLWQWLSLIRSVLL